MLQPLVCPNDWSLDPISSSQNTRRNVYCYDHQFLCEESDCYEYPVCSSCTSDKGKLAKTVACKNEYHASDPTTDQQAICVSSDETFWQCSGPCEGYLKCINFSRKGPFIKSQLRKRGNPFAVAMNGSPGGTSSNFDSVLSF
ncbi:secreted protein [Phakopsora pachyrhizi]|nr:secreted protein [Phakopsora pachyrhizi]